MSSNLTPYDCEAIYIVLMMSRVTIKHIKAIYLNRVALGVSCSITLIYITANHEQQLRIVNHMLISKAIAVLGVPVEIIST